jgi:hypothetical protein
MKDGLAAANEATWLALRTHHDAIAATAALVGAATLAERADALSTAEVWFALAEAVSARAAMSPMFEFQLLETRGAIHAQRGDLTGAIEAHEKALAVVRALGPANSFLWSAELNLAATMARAGAFVAAIPHLERVPRSRRAARSSSRNTDGRTRSRTTSARSPRSKRAAVPKTSRCGGRSPASRPRSVSSTRRRRSSRCSSARSRSA